MQKIVTDMDTFISVLQQDHIGFLETDIAISSPLTSILRKLFGQ